MEELRSGGQDTVVVQRDVPVSQTGLSLVSSLLGKQQSSTTDGELLQSFLQDQSEAAFAELMQRHSAMVFAVARRLLGSATDAEDVSQATFLLLARKASTLRRERSLAGWLYGVARRLSADLRKQQKRREKREGIASTQRSTETAEPLLLKQETFVKLDTELSHLHVGLREPLVLHCLEGLSHQEIATRLGIAMGTVASRLHRAKELLKSRLVRAGVGPALSVALFSGIAQARIQPTLSLTAAQAVLRHHSVQTPVHTLVSSVSYSLYTGAIYMSWKKQIQLAAAAVLVGGFSLWGANTLLASPQGDPVFSTISTQTQDEELKRLQGTWYCVAIVPGGTNEPPAEALNEMKKMQLIFEGDMLSLKVIQGDPKPLKAKLDSKSSPKRLELFEGDKSRVRALYSVDGDVLIFTFQEGREGFPATLAATKELSGAMVVLQKLRPYKMDNTPANPMLRQMAAKNIAQNSMRQIGLAFHNYVNDNNKFPENIKDKNGKPLLSWRVLMLPYLEQEALFRQFKLDEPWDSEHNKALISKMPKFFSVDDKTEKNHTTAWQRWSGVGTAFEPDNKLNFNDLTDGTSNTIFLAEAEETVPWTKPADLEFDANKPLPKLGTRFGNEHQVVMLDGSSRSWPATAKEAMLKAFITRAGGEVVEFPQLPEVNSKAPAK
jgi:RNA polymerase sigma factor (sigma-70 family)